MTNQRALTGRVCDCTRVRRALIEGMNMLKHGTIGRGLGACAIVSGIWLFTAVHAAPVSSDPEAKAKMETPAEKIRKALDKNISIKSNNQPLTRALRIFSAGVSIFAFA